jgi:hypothetical protein
VIGEASKGPISGNDYFLRARILKLRWMGMEDEVAELLKLIGDKPHCLMISSISRLPRDPINTD